MTEEKLIEFCHKWIQKIQEGKSVLKSDNEQALLFYQSDPSIVKLIKNRSQITTTDLLDAVKAAKPDILEIFAGGDQVVSLQPEGEEDVEAVKLMNELINKQVRRKNNWFVAVNDFLEDLFVLKFGLFKCWWHKSITYREVKLEGIDDIQFNAKISEPGVAVLEHEETIVQAAVLDDMGMEVKPPVFSHNVTLEYTIVDEYPKIDVRPSDKVGFPLTSKDISEAPFLFDCVSLPKWQFIERYGEAAFEKVEDVKNDLFDEKSKEIDRFKDIGGKGFVYDDKEDLYHAYECYFPHPDTGRQWLFILNGDVVLYNKKNPEGAIPFFGATPYKLAHRAVGLSWYDLLKEIMTIKTTVYRQIMDNLYQSNYRRYFVDKDRINMKDYLDNNTTNAAIRCEGDPSTVVFPERKGQLPAELFTFLESIEVNKDYHVLPRAYTGVSSRVLADTWRGQNQQVQQASKPIQMLARLIAEMAIAPMMRHIMNLNILYLKKETSIRYLNQWIPFKVDNIALQADAVVNVGVGTGSKADIIAQMQQLLGLDQQIFKAGLGIVTAENVFNKIKELVKAMGFRNTSDFVTDPKTGEAVRGLTEALMGLMQMLQQTGMPPPPMIGQIMQTIQQLNKDFGLPMPNMPPPPPPQQPQGGINDAGTFPGQNTPAQPPQPMQPMNPRMTPDGGGFFA